MSKAFIMFHNYRHDKEATNFKAGIALPCRQLNQLKLSIEEHNSSATQIIESNSH